MSSVVIAGDTSGSITLQAPAVAGSTTLTLPATSSTIATNVNGTLYPLVSGTAVASTSGTSIDFTGIPSWVKRITVMFNGVSTNGSSQVIIQLGDSGGVETSGYVGAASYTAAASTSWSSGIMWADNSSVGANYLRHGTIVISNINSNVWAAFGVTANATSNTFVTSGTKELSATLDRIRITTVNGTDTFDAGSINILYE